MIVGKITAKSQTTIPKAVRNALGIKPGDEVGWEIDGNSVTIIKVNSTEGDPFIGNFSTFTEWADEIDAAFDVLDIGAVVRVPFPITEKKGRKFRPALVVARFQVTTEIALLWTLMITGANRDKWAGDIELPDHEAIGLPIPSMIRTAKIATIDVREAERIAQIDGELLQRILAGVRVGLAP